jgi:uncharacterized cupin superfamily protein
MAMPSAGKAMLNENDAGFECRAGGYGGHLGMSGSRFDMADEKEWRLSAEVLEPVETSASERGLTKPADMANSTIPDGNSTMNIIAESISRINPEDVDLRPDPIPTDWILAGAPEARVTKLQTSRDWTSSVVLWECTRGSFRWQYSKDETVFFLAGEAFMTDDSGEEHRFGAGDVAVIAAGTNCKWRVTEPIRKVAVVRETIWRPLGFMLKVSKKLFRGEHSELKSDNRPSTDLNKN